MKKLLPLTLIFFLTVNVLVLFAESPDGSVTDFINQDQEESPELEDAEQPTVDRIEENETSIFGLILRVLLALGLIIGLIYVLLKLFNKSGHFNKQGGALTNLGGISLGTNKSIQMLKVGERVYLVGVGDTITLLTEVTDEAVKQQMIEGNQTSPTTMNSFISQFNFKKSKVESVDEQNEAENSENFASLFKRELNVMKQKRRELRSKYEEEE